MEEEICSGDENVRSSSEIADENEELSNNMVSIDIPKELPKKRNRSSVHRLPASVRAEFQDSDCTPRKVSFGPYHHELCLPTEQNKKQVLDNVLKRSRKSLNDYKDALRGIVEELRDAYDELDPVWEQDTDAFLQLMIVDGCFLLEILRAEHRSHLPYWLRFVDDVAPGVDRSNHSEMEGYRRDMRLLENQLPMLLLVKLAALQNIKEHIVVDTSKSLIRIFTRHNYFGCLEAEEPRGEIICSNVLDVYRRALLHDEYKLDKILHKEKGKSKMAEFARKLSFRGSTQFNNPTAIELDEFNNPTAIELDEFNIPTATELDKVGIQFTTSKTKSLLDTSFQRRTLKLPRIKVDDATRSMMLNMIAFEQFHADTGREVTSYIHFMSSLLQGPDDVKLLKSRGIILSNLRNEEVADMFCKLRKIKVVPEIFFAPKLQGVAEQLKTRFKKMSVEWRKELFLTYLRTPCAIVSLIVASLIFACTIIGSVYTVLSYYNRK